ncbi:MAG: diphosphomevalonate decarboxylase [Anaerolineae bacterium]|nr:diphosphomevalonate decarboxylase [Anaerolineae bacterium]NUQ02473.1 diphosphomevalonate decarboxylase [Anaerolineae bacterium]
MAVGTAHAQAHPNIALIKYWGNRDERLRLPANSSLSFNLSGLQTTTQVTWIEDKSGDSLILNGREARTDELSRVIRHLDMLRSHLGIRGYAHVESGNNFPTGTGIASSASAFAALTAAATSAAGLHLDERTLTTLARLGSGSAARSIPAGFVEWHASDAHEDSYAESIAPADHWTLIDVIAIVSTSHKAVGSTAGHASAATSDLQNARVAGAERRLTQCRSAVLTRDFAALAEVVEEDSNLMHAVMMTSRPPLFYWLPATLAIMAAVRRWRTEGLQVCYTLDAGPNIHCICGPEAAAEVRNRLQSISGVVDIRSAPPGGGVTIERLA